MSYPVAIVPQNPVDLLNISKLMQKYKDVPMDYADATLVVLAEKKDVSSVFTMDRKGFGSYRIGKIRRFEIFP